MQNNWRKFLYVLVTAVVFSAMLACSAFAAEKTVYLAGSGDDTQNGTSYRTAVKTFERAYALIGNGDGRIVVCSPVNIGTNYTMPVNAGQVRITASDGAYYFPLGRLIFSEALTFSGDTVLDRIQLVASGTSMIACGGHNVTFGERLETDGNVVLLGGYNVTGSMTAEDASIANDYTITVNGGEFLYFRGGNRRAGTDSPFGTISGNCTLNINGGTFTSRDGTSNLNSATGMNIQTGNTTLTINGGNIYGSLFAVSRAGTYSGSAPYVSGNVTITVNGGQINGASLNLSQDGTVNMQGQYTLNLNDGSFANITSIKGNDSAVIHVSDAVKNAAGITHDTFQNPLRPGPDPWVTYHDGYYYMVLVSGTKILCYKSATLNGLAYAEGVTIWSAPSGSAITNDNKMYSKEIWSAELHYVEADEFGEEYAGWWLYFAADDGDNVNHRLYTVRALTDSATGQYGSPITKELNVPAKIVVNNDETWAIGQSLLRVNGKTYMTWTSETGRGTSTFKQDIRIAELSNPYTITGTVGTICVPQYDWEKHGAAYNASTGASYPEVVEGATAVYGDNGEIIIIYSASGYWTNYYCLATLTLTPGADPLLASSWTKSNQPVFSHQNGVYGPGHAAYTFDAEGNRWMIYHAYLNSQREGGRYVFIQPYTLTGATVDMNGGPYAQDTVLTISNNRRDVMTIISGFGTVN